MSGIIMKEVYNIRVINKSIKKYIDPVKIENIQILWDKSLDQVDFVWYPIFEYMRNNRHTQ